MAATIVAEAGMDPMKFLTETDPLRRVAMMDIANAFAERDQIRREDLARRIIARLAESMK
jgi:hypothetical protein